MFAEAGCLAGAYGPECLVGLGGAGGYPGDLSGRHLTAAGNQGPPVIATGRYGRYRLSFGMAARSGGAVGRIWPIDGGSVVAKNVAKDPISRREVIPRIGPSLSSGGSVRP
jgi:hypothetical protein